MSIGPYLPTSWLGWLTRADSQVISRKALPVSYTRHVFFAFRRFYLRRHGHGVGGRIVNNGGIVDDFVFNIDGADERDYDYVVKEG